jgi:hypothetical protein
MHRLAIEVDIRAPWVKAWGRLRKVATRSKIRVNTTPLKKPAVDGLNMKFKRVNKEEDRWVNIPRKLKEGKPLRGKGKAILRTDVSKDGGSCIATFKENQNSEKYGKNMKKEGAKVETLVKDKRTYHPE